MSVFQAFIIAFPLWIIAFKLHDIYEQLKKK